MINRRALVLGAAAAPLFLRKAAAENTVYVLAWGGYPDDGLTARFAALTGSNLQIDTVGSYDDIFFRLRSPYGNRYSVVVPHHGLTHALQQQDLIQPVDTAQLTHFTEIDPHFELGDDTTVAGQKYAVPVIFGTTPCIYNPNKLKDLPTSWADLDSDEFSGKVGMVDDALSHYFVAGRAIGSTTLPMLSNDEYARTTNLLISIKQNRVSHFTLYATDMAEQLRKGKAVISTTGWEGMTLMTESGGKLAVARLAPGDFSFVQTLAIAREAPDPHLAHKFIDMMLNTNEQAGLANRTQRGVVNLGAVPAVDPALAALTNYADLDAVFAQSPILGFPPLSHTGQSTATYSDWVVGWDQVRQTTSKASD